MRTRIAVASVVATIVFATGASGALADGASLSGLSPFHSISGVSLGMTKTTFLRVLHDPNAGPARRVGSLVEYGFSRGHPSRDLYVTVDRRLPGEKVVDVQGSGPYYRTAGGIGAGSTPAQLRRGIRGVACHSGYCYASRGSVKMSFSIDNGRIGYIELGQGHLRYP